MNSFLIRTIASVFWLTVPALTLSAAEPRAESAPSEKKEAIVTFNVFGAVEKPGTYTLPQGSTLLDALGAAGGWQRNAVLGNVSILSRSPDQKSTVSYHDVSAILRGGRANPSVGNHDSILVPERKF